MEIFEKPNPSEPAEVSLEKLKTMLFNEEWTDDKTAKMLIEYGKHSPLGIEDLQKKGLTGKGVTVAIIDAPTALNHPEYEGKILQYNNFCDKRNVSNFVATAVTSLLVGDTVGVVPDAKVVYAAVPTWKRNAIYAVKALDWILKFNKNLPESEKIKVVATPELFGDEILFYKNWQLWNNKVKEAQNNGICVVENTNSNRFVAPGYVDINTKEFKYGFPDRPISKINDEKVYVPVSHRTVASSHYNTNFSYTYCGVGGLMYAVPYAAGVLCMGQQANPTLSGMQLKNLLIDSAKQNNNIIDPKGFVEKVKQTVKEK